ncbi:ATP-binding protein [Streptomyces sp. NPDC058471]|uniref:ATP-binding protein n=1 Tax=Streptomyces sp. NPDC058471 TaxID=3346516 RepID=UPI003663D14E
MNVPQLTPAKLVGRTVQLDQLIQAAAHPPSLIVVSGEAGVGKTRLVTEILKTVPLRDRLHLSGGCIESPHPPPLEPLIGALTALPPETLDGLPALAGALAPLLPELAHLLPPPLGPLGDARAERHRQLRAAHALLDHLGSAVLVLEDLHWADASTWDFLRQLTSRLPRQLSLILTDRADNHRPASSRALYHRIPGTLLHEIRLEPLTTQETGEFAAQLLGAETVSDDFAERLHRRTAGLPFAIEEVLRLLTSHDSPPSVQGDRLEQAGLPVPVRDVLLHRLNALPKKARSVVAAAAVAGRAVCLDLLGDITGLDEPDTRHALTLALDHAVLHPSAGATYDFRHSLARQAAYEAICLPERRALHLRTAKALLAHSSPLPLAQIAHHYQQAERSEQYLRYTEAAGDRAEAHGDSTAATEHFHTALHEHPSSRARIRLGLKLGRAAIAAMPHPATITALRRLLTEDHLPLRARGELRLYLGTLMRNQTGGGLDGINEIARAVRDLTPTAPDLAARALSAIAIPSLKGWPLSQHLYCLDQADQLIHRVTDPVQRTAITANRASALMLSGSPDAWEAARALPAQTENPAEEVQLARGWINLAHATTALGHPEGAGDYLAQADDILQRNGIPYLEGLAETAHLLLRWTTGSWSGLAERADRAAALYADIPDLAAEALLVRGLLHLHAQGDTNAARHDLLRAAHSTQLDTGIVLTASAAGIARIHLAAQRHDQARTAANEALHYIRRTDGWIWATDIAPTALHALALMGHLDHAGQLVRDFAHGIDGRDAPAASAALITCQGLLAEAEERHHDAERLFAEGEIAWQRIGRPIDQAGAREARGRCLLPHHPQQAEQHIATAIDIYRRSGATWDISRCQRLLRRHGIVLAQRRGPLGYGDQLSPREAEVALLAAQGHSNREIAARLSVSHRTIEQHVAKAMRKLGVSRRSELAAANPNSA